IAAYAVSAIDIALWDLKGKAHNASVLDLLGGPVHERLPAIASCHAHFESIPDMVDEAKEWLSSGLQGVKIGFGKRGNARLGYERVRATGTVDVVGVDPGRAEGITGFKKVCDRVEFYRRQANAHAWSSAIVTAASLAISFSTPACKLFEFKPLRNPMQHDLVTEPFEHVDGWVFPPSGPGLGIEVIEEVVDGFRSEKVLAA